MDAGADQMCEAPGNSRNGYRERSLLTCVGRLTLKAPKLRTGSLFPEDVLTRYQRVDRALAAAVAETVPRGRAPGRCRGSRPRWTSSASRRTG